MLRHLTVFQQDLHKISSQGIVKDLYQDLHMSTPTKISQNVHKRTCCFWRGSYKILKQEPPKSTPEELSDKHLIRSICKIFMQWTLERILPGSPQDLLTRACIKIMRGPFREDLTRISTRSSDKDLWEIMKRPLGRCQQDLHKSFSCGPVQDHARASERISSGSSKHLLPRASAKFWPRSSNVTGP